MIRLTESVWIGDSQDEGWADLGAAGVGAILNVAQDLPGTRGWRHGVEYAQVGLIDGPGNPPASYYAAVLALAALLRRHRVLVCCHDGGRALAVVLMYLQVTGGRGWEGRLALISERVEARLPVPHAAHRAAFDKLNWRLLTAAVEVG